ncbi:MAG: VTT domain-containing protein [SAR202 cluster bacterium]|nr:VTT domain-containing protein [SAR202 cluster bacterium]
MEQRRFYATVKIWMDRRGTLVLFTLSIIPNPIFDFVGIEACRTRYPFRRFVLTVFIGKMLKGLIVSCTYTCSFGLSLLHWVN